MADFDQIYGSQQSSGGDFGTPGVSVWVGYGPKPAPRPGTLTGRPEDRPSTRPDLTVTVDDALAQFPELSAAEQASWSKAYYDIYGANPTYDQLLNFYNGAVQAAAATYAGGAGERKTPLDLAQEQAVAAIRLRQSQGLPALGTQVDVPTVNNTSSTSSSTDTSTSSSNNTTNSTSVQLTNMDDAKAITNSVFQQLLGRAATTAEVKKFKKLLNEAERSNPNRTRTNTQSDSTTTSSQSSSSQSSTVSTPQGQTQPGGAPGQGQYGGRYEGSTWVENTPPAADPLAPQVANTATASSGSSSSNSATTSTTNTSSVSSGGVNPQQQAIDYAKTQKDYAEYQAAKYTAALINMLGEAVRIG